MEFLPPDIENYVLLHTTEESPLLKRLNRDTHANVLMPRMLSGNLQGRMLAMISHMIKPKRILEIGTFTGYSALCMAEGLAENGKLITIDINEELEERVRSYFATSGVNSKIIYHIGNALTIIPELTEIFDIVFIDETNSCEFQVTVLFFGGIDAPFVMLIGAAQIVTKL